MGLMFAETKNFNQDISK
ncbi:hypothetical protein JIY74_33460 [Vibrio harveyi]|nr:hypothetical protein [Vibrio harveyi]